MVKHKKYENKTYDKFLYYGGMKMKYLKNLALFVAFCMVLSTLPIVVGATSANDTGALTAAADDTETEATPAPTETPDVEATPEVTETPDATEEPDVTAEPDVTKDPDATAGK